MYGLDSFVIAPPISILISLLLLLGCDKLGIQFFSSTLFQFNDDPRRVLWIRSSVGLMLLAILLYPLALLNLADLLLLRVVALLLACVGGIHAISLVRQRVPTQLAIGLTSFFFKSPLHKLLVLLAGSYCIYALTPITNADSLDYHVGVALHILNTGGLPFTPEWLTSRLAGSGEIINALGLAVGAEHFGGLLQIAALAGILGIVVSSHSLLKNRANDHWNILLAVLMLSPPVLLFLVDSVKPQLLPIALTTFAITLVVHMANTKLEASTRLKCFSLVCIMVMTAAQQKFSYLLGGGIVGLMAMGIMVRHKQTVRATGLGLFWFMIILLPPALWKSFNYKAHILESLFTPLPGNWYATVAFENMLRNYQENILPFPVSLLIPSGFGNISTILGVGVFFFLFLNVRNKRNVQLLIVAALIVVFMSWLLGPPTSRSYLEPYYWVLMALSMQGAPHFFSRHMRVVSALPFFQGVSIVMMCWFGIATSVPALVSMEGRAQVMSVKAYGYAMVTWMDSVLPEYAVVLDTYRSMGIIPRKAVSLIWSRHAAIDDPRALPYVERVREEGVTHMLIVDASLQDSLIYQFFSRCVNGVPSGPFAGTVATRNPFNRGAPYQAWLVPLDADRIPDCLD